MNHWVIILCIKNKIVFNEKTTTIFESGASTVVPIEEIAEDTSSASLAKEPFFVGSNGQVSELKSSQYLHDDHHHRRSYSHR